MFYRIDRLFEWKEGSGMQLENALTSIASSGFLGHGFNRTPLYFPESSTDFIFAVFSSNFGFIITIILILTIFYFDIYIIKLSKRTTNYKSKFILIGISSCLIFQHIENIGMTLGILPITGITLPFISYGGSSLLSYMIMLGIIINITREKRKKYY
jgi:cell division protein FtsW (lipid II flippase)